MTTQTNMSHSSSPDSKIVLVNNFDHYLKLIEGEKRVIVLDFSAQWCGPCKKLLPVLDKLAQDFSNQVLVLTVDADHDQQIEDDDQKMSPHFKIEALPTLVFLKNCTFQTGDDFRIEGYGQAQLEKLKTALKTLANITPR